MTKAKLPRRVVPTCCVLIIESKPGRAPKPVRSRWHCDSCGEGGDWTTPEEANAQGEAHVERVRSGR